MKDTQLTLFDTSQEDLEKAHTELVESYMVQQFLKKTKAANEWWRDTRFRNGDYKEWQTYCDATDGLDTLKLKPIHECLEAYPELYELLDTLRPF